MRFRQTPILLLTLGLMSACGDRPPASPNPPEKSNPPERASENIQAPVQNAIYSALGLGISLKEIRVAINEDNQWRCLETDKWQKEYGPNDFVSVGGKHEELGDVVFVISGRAPNIHNVEITTALDSRYEEKEQMQRKTHLLVDFLAKTLKLDRESLLEWVQNKLIQSKTGGWSAGKYRSQREIVQRKEIAFSLALRDQYLMVTIRVSPLPPGIYPAEPTTGSP